MDKYNSNQKKKQLLSAFKEAFKDAPTIQHNKKQLSHNLGKKREEVQYEHIEPINREQNKRYSSTLAEQVQLMVENTALLAQNMAKLVALQLQPNISP